MQLKDRTDAYGWVSIALHWIVAIAIVTLWLLGDRLDDQPTRDLRREALALHISVGALVWIFLVARILWRATQGHPAAPKQHPALNLLSYLVQYGLLLAITVQIITGPLTIWTIGRPINVFGWFSIPSPLERNVELHETLESIHSTNANVILALVILHVLGALKHLVIDRDGVFRRMLGPRS